MWLEVLLHFVEFFESSFSEAPEGFDSVDMDLSLQSKLILSMIDAEVLVITYIHQAVIASPPIGANETANIDLFADNGL